MYVCICNAIKEHEIRAQARKGVYDTPEELVESLNGCFQCGLCIEHVECLIEEETAVICGKRPESDASANNNISQQSSFIKVAAE